MPPQNLTMNNKNDEPQSDRFSRSGWSSNQTITLVNALSAHTERLRRSHRRLLDTEPSLHSFPIHHLGPVVEVDNDSSEMSRHRDTQRSFANRLRILEVLEAASRLFDELIDYQTDDELHDQLSD